MDFRHVISSSFWDAPVSLATSSLAKFIQAMWILGGPSSESSSPSGVVPSNLQISARQLPVQIRERRSQSPRARPSRRRRRRRQPPNLLPTQSIAQLGLL